MHVAVGGEGLAAHAAFVRPLPTVYQHVPVQRAGRAQGFSTDAAGVVSTSILCIVLKTSQNASLKISHGLCYTNMSSCIAGSNTTDILISKL